MKIQIKSKPERIEKYNGYIIRTIRSANSIIAIPENATCYYHPKFKFEQENQAFRVMKDLIDEGKKTGN